MFVNYDTTNNKKINWQVNQNWLKKIKELKKSRDHTENILKFTGSKIKIKKFKTYNLISIEGQKDFKAFDLNIPGDISSAAFFIVLTLLGKRSLIKIKNINLNPTRTGIIIILKNLVNFKKFQPT